MNFIENMIFIVNILHILCLCIITTHVHFVNTIPKAEKNYFQCFRTCYSVEVNLKKAAESQWFFPLLFDHRCTKPD